jgi:hypothetical protein
MFAMEFFEFERNRLLSQYIVYRVLFTILEVVAY